jgi:spore germination protein YaaH
VEVQDCGYEELNKEMEHIMRYDISYSQRKMRRMEMITLLRIPVLSYLIYSPICVVMVLIIEMVSTLVDSVMLGVPFGGNRWSYQQVATIKVLIRISGNEAVSALRRNGSSSPHSEHQCLPNFYTREGHRLLACGAVYTDIYLSSGKNI